MESDWQKMEKMLDEQAIERAALLRAKHLRQAAFSIIVLLLISIGIYFISFSDKNDVSGARNETPEKTQTASGAIAATNETTPDTGGEHQLSSNESSSANNQKMIEQEKPENPSLVRSADYDSAVNATVAKTEKKYSKGIIAQMQNKPDVTPKQELLSVTTEIRKNSNNKVNIIERERESPDASDIKIHVTDEQGQENNTIGQDRKDLSTAALVSIEDGAVSVNDENINDRGIATGINTDEEKIADSVVVVAAVKEIDEDKKLFNEQSSPEEEQQLIPMRWNAALIVAPDFTSTALGKYTAPGRAFGITIGYRIFSRLSVSTGLIISTKKYEGFGSDYHPPKGYWVNKTNGIIPDEIAGTCEVYEIPVMLQYILLQRQKNSVYFSTGVSSYLMASQRYSYTYGEPNPGAARGWSTSESSSYPFNIGHFSVAYERQIFSKLAVGLEPYMKIPFTGMGWSDVDLFSAGVFINFRYRFFKRERIVTVKELKQRK